MFKVESIVDKGLVVDSETETDGQILGGLSNVLEIQRVLPALTSDDIKRLAAVASASQDSQSEMNRLLAVVAQ